MKQILLLLICFPILVSCQTVDFQKTNAPVVSTLTEEEEEIVKKEEETYIIEELIKEIDVSPTIIYITPPEIRYSPQPVLPEDSKPLNPIETLQKNTLLKTIVPEIENGRLKSWVYKKDNIYEVHTQTFHSTLIQFEPGEEMVEVPYLSEPDVWRIARGVSYVDNLPTQHLIIKPDFTKLISTLIVVTNRRIYHMELKSYNDNYMPVVRWLYFDSVKNTESWNSWESQNKLIAEFSGVNPEFLSFDYKMNHSLFNKPLWLPKQVYDDGHKTYIILDEQCIHMELPVLFNEKNRIVNYRTQKNILIIDQLIEKATLRLGTQKVSIEKKKLSNFIVQSPKEDVADAIQ